MYRFFSPRGRPRDGVLGNLIDFAWVLSGAWGWWRAIQNSGFELAGLDRAQPTHTQNHLLPTLKAHVPNNGRTKPLKSWVRLVAGVLGGADVLGGPGLVGQCSGYELFGCMPTNSNPELIISTAELGHPSAAPRKKWVRVGLGWCWFIVVVMHLLFSCGRCWGPGLAGALSRS